MLRSGLRRAHDDDDDDDEGEGLYISSRLESA